MATRFDKTRKHTGPSIPYVGGKDDDEYEFDIPRDEELTDVKLELLEGRYRDGVRLEQAPRRGAVGPDQKIKVHWWFDGGFPPPGFVKYRVRAFTRHVELKNAIVCAIENTRSVPMPDMDFLPREMRAAIEAFTSNMAELFEEANLMSLVSAYYDNVTILRDSECTKENIREALLSHGDDYRVDLTFVGHGSTNSLMMYGGQHLTNTDIGEWKDSGDFTDRRLGIVYMMNCKGSSLNDDWRSLGFETSIGPVSNNWMPEPMFSNFWARYRNGVSASQAAQRSWERAKEAWSIIYPPHPIWVRTGRMPWEGRIEWRDHENITSSKPVVRGNGRLKINTRV